jgi:hypothetical protein
MLSAQGADFSRMFTELIAAFAWGGVEVGRRLRNVREFAEALATVLALEENQGGGGGAGGGGGGNGVDFRRQGLASLLLTERRGTP